jgi:hypothetical protein
MWTKTGRRMAYGKQLGEWAAKQHCSSDTMEPKSLVYKDRIEIMNGLDTDEEGYWLRDKLALIEPSNYTDNLYKGVPKVYVNKAVLCYPNYREVIERAIEKVLPVKGDVTILKDGTLFVNKKPFISLEFIVLVALLLVAVLFSYTDQKEK